MQELSMNILDIAENSVSADATLVEISLVQNTAQATQTLTIRDNGRGMDAEMVQNVTDPFCTTRTTRDVGLGVPFLKMAAEMTGGAFSINSTPGEGTLVTAVFTLGHIDLAPLGDMGSTISALVQANPDIDISFTFARDGAQFAFHTNDARAILGDVSLSEPSVALFLREHVNDGIASILASPA